MLPAGAEAQKEEDCIKLLTVAAVTLTVALTPVTTATPGAASTGLRSSASTPTCVKVFTQTKHASYARAVFKRDRITKKAKKRLVTMRRCMHSTQARVNARRLVRKLRKRWKERRSLTPYDCGRHGRFAIPCGIVACESRFDWGARNPSGAWGAYQLLGWLPYGASREAQHRMAAKLWQGGAGASHWVCKA